MRAARPRALGPAVSCVLVPVPIPARVLLYKYHLILLVGCRPALPQLHPLHGMGWALGSDLPWGARDISGHLQHAQGSLSRLP